MKFLVQMVAIAILMSCTACINKSSFVCERDQQCVQDGLAGRCEATNFCSFPDEGGTCASGYIYGVTAGDESGNCVPGVDAGSDVDAGPQECAIQIAELALGLGHSCLRTQDGVVQCWGDNSSGQLGVGSFAPNHLPSTVHLPIIDQLSAGNTHTCALEGNGYVWCWGLNSSSQLGTEGAVNQTRPALAAGLSDAISISAGSNHTCAIRADGGAVCWGHGFDLQLGNGIRSNSSEAVSVQHTNASGDVVPMADVTLISAGTFHTCALAGGEVYCWGQNNNGQLGDGTFEIRETAVKVLGLPGSVKALSAGGDFTCVRMEAGEVYCWGGNTVGQLGNGTLVPKNPIPAKIPNLIASGISVGFGHACALSSAGTALCWGRNANGQIGNGQTVNYNTPVEILPGTVQVEVGYNHTCAVLENGSMQCWGANKHSQLGDGTPIYFSEPTLVSLPEAVDEIAVGDNHSCALLSGGQVRCWGQNNYSQIGVDETVDVVTDPTSPVRLVSGQEEALEGMVAIRASGNASCALSAPTAVGNALCWGYRSGLLGIDAVSSATVPHPTPIAYGSAIRDLVLGGRRTFVEGDGATPFACWGDNYDGACGILGDTASSNEPRDATLLNLDDKTVVAGQTHSCVLTTHGAVRCFGNNFGHVLGSHVVATQGGPAVPVPLSGPATQLVSVGDASTCALLADNGVECWGHNTQGQLGNGSSPTTPARVRLPADAERLAGGMQRACVIRSDRSVWCWGNNPLDLFRTGRPARFVSIPVQVTTVPAKQVEIGESHMCLVHDDDNSVYCWGSGLRGQIATATALEVVMTPSPTVISCE